MTALGQELEAPEVLSPVLCRPRLRGALMKNGLESLAQGGGLSRHRYCFEQLAFNVAIRDGKCQKALTGHGLPSLPQLTEEHQNPSPRLPHCAPEALQSHMQMVTEIAVPTVCTLCVLIAAVLLVVLLQRQH